MAENPHSGWYKKSIPLAQKGTARKIAFLNPDAQVKKNKISQECVTGQLLCEFVV